MELDIKRFYIPIHLLMDCPECKHEWVIEPNKEYISYPDTEKNNFLYFMCPKCDEELEMVVDIIFKVNPQYVTIKKQ